MNKSGIHVVTYLYDGIFFLATFWTNLSNFSNVASTLLQVRGLALPLFVSTLFCECLRGAAAHSVEHMAADRRK